MYFKRTGKSRSTSVIWKEWQCFFWDCQFISSVNQLPGFYMMTNLAFNELIQVVPKSYHSREYEGILMTNVKRTTVNICQNTGFLWAVPTLWIREKPDFFFLKLNVIGIQKVLPVTVYYFITNWSVRKLWKMLPYHYNRNN